MKYKEKGYAAAVSGYKRLLRNKVKDKVILISIDSKHESAFFSLGPLSQAVHALGGDIFAKFTAGKSASFEILKDVWYIYDELKKKVDSKKVKTLEAFISAVEKRTKTKGKAFRSIFEKPDVVLLSNSKGFTGTFDVPYKIGWHKRYRWKDLVKTSKRILQQGYALKKGEVFALEFVLVPEKKHLELPLEDYLDSFLISLSFFHAAKSMGARVSMQASTARFSRLERINRVVDLLATLRGCEYDKDVNEEVFKKFKIFSKLVSMDPLMEVAAFFGIHAKGYPGRHFFGETIGYPTLDKKTRWSSPGQMMMKDPFSPQTPFEKRDPMMRLAITETLPIDIYIKTCYVDYHTILRRSKVIKRILDKCQKVRVVGKVIKGYQTDFTVDLIRENGQRQYFKATDCDVTTIHDKDFYKRTGIKAGAFANFPSGECFVTPADVKGTMIGDVVINIDRSYTLDPKNPLLVSFSKKGYKVVKGSKHILQAMKKERDEGKTQIAQFVKHRSLPKMIIDIYKKNFWKVGEFSINTNPTAELCHYLIVNEKIANMIHLALGMGFDSDRKTVYHWDIVVNAPRQKMNIYGVDSKNKVHWILKNGKFVV